MKHLLLSLVALFAMAISSFAVGETFIVKFDDGVKIVDANDTEISTPSVSCTVSGDINYNAKYKTSSWEGLSIAKGLKMQKATVVTISVAATSTVTLVKSLSSNPDNVLNFDGEAVPMANAKETVEGDYATFEFTDVAVGEHSIKRNGNECGILAIKITYTAEAKTVLDAPEVSANEETGLITIGSVENATKIVYEYVTVAKDTTIVDYTEPFTISEDGYVNAWAVGEGKYADSPKASITVALANAPLDAPTLVQVNGTVGIKTSQIKTAVEYSLDKLTWFDATVNPTLTENATVFARARRGESNFSEVASIEVNSVIAKPEGTKRVLLSYPDGQDADNEVIVTAAGVEGFLMKIATNTSKNWSSAKSITLPGEGENLSWKLSNGAGNTLEMPDGVVAKRATFYSYVNGAAGTSYWYEVNGDTIDAKVDDVVYMNSTDASNPDVRVFDFGEGVSKFSFTNKGVQLCFVIALDVTGIDATPFKITNTEAVGGTATVNAEAYKGDKVTIRLAQNEGFAIDTVEITGVDKLTWGKDSEGKISKKTATFIMPSADVVVTPVFKSTAEPSSIRSLATDAEDAKTFNLQGVKVDASYKGLVIRGGKKFLQK